MEIEKLNHDAIVTSTFQILEECITEKRPFSENETKIILEFVKRTKTHNSKKMDREVLISRLGKWITCVECLKLLYEYFKM